jgi:hypothetical protein
MNRWTETRIVFWFAAIILACCWFGVANAQTAPWFYQCPTDTQANGSTVVGTTAHNHTSCPSWTWGPLPASNADKPLLAFCTSNATCNWNANNVRWKRPRDVVAADFLSLCGGNRNSGDNCTPQFFQRGIVLPPPVNPVNCVVSEWSEWVAGEWSQCASGQQTRQESRTRAVLTPASNGGSSCPTLTDSRTVSQSCAMPAPSAQISLSSHRVYTNEPVIVTWSSTNADFCSASWAESIPFSGTQSLTMTVPNTEHWVYVACINPYGNYRADVGFRVVSRAPDCYPDQDRPGDSDKVEVKAISVANMTLRYQVFATWFCATPDGPKQQKWAIGMEDGFREARNWLNKRFNKAAAIARCETECEPLPDGALKTELDEWAAQFTSAELGVIDP